MVLRNNSSVTSTSRGQKFQKFEEYPKSANQNGRPSRSLKSKRKHTQHKKRDPPRPQRRAKSGERRYSEAETSQYPSVVPSKPENRKNEPEKR